MTHPHLDDLIHSIYEGILEPTPWQGFLTLLLQAVDARVVSLVLRAPATGDQGLILNCLRPENHNTQAQTTLMADPNDWPSVAYKEHFFALDPFIHLPMNQVISLHELVPEDELLRSDYYQNYLEPAGVYHILGIDTCSADGTEARLRLSRPFGEKAFSSCEKALCQNLISHLQRAIGLRARLNHIESERNVLANVMDKLAVGTILLDEQGRVIKANSIATRLLEGQQGLYLQDHLLLAGDPGVNRQLQQIIADSLTALKNPAQASIIKALSVPRQQKADLSLVIRPVPAPAYAEGQAAPALAIFISARTANRHINSNPDGIVPAQPGRSPPVPGAGARAEHCRSF